MFTIVIVFILVFSLVIFAHELGHFYFARRAGVLVEEFGFGLPPRLWGIKKNGTIYSINLIPFGGFVKLYGEGDEFAQDKKSFVSKKPAQKFWIVVGGVLMNFALGFLVMMIGFWAAMPPLVTPPEYYQNGIVELTSRVVVIEAVTGSPAEKAGLLSGDYILSLNQQLVNLPTQIKEFVKNQTDKPVKLLVQRGETQLEILVTPKVGSTGESEIGILLDRSVDRVQYVWWQVPWVALQETGRIVWVVIISIIGLLRQIITTASLPTELAGPVGIARITADVVQMGWLRVLQFIIFLSINLGVINLVPFPALDGGRAVFAVVEWLRRGKKVPGHIENAVNTVGFMLLIGLLLVVTYKDIVRLFL